MPKHTYWFSFILDLFPALKHNASALGTSFIGHEHPTWRGTEPVLTAFLYMGILLVLALYVRSKFRQLDQAVVPDATLTLPGFFEIFLGFFYGMARDVMGPANAKRYFPIIGGASLFIFFSNIVGLLPGVSSPTSNLNVTMGCALAVFLAFNYYGLKEQGWAYIAHLAGPKWYLAPLIFPIEVISTCVRPITLMMRLMVNISVDHLLAAIFLSLVALFVPIPIALLGVVVCIVQTIVFALLTSIYIGLATEHADAH